MLHHVAAFPAFDRKAADGLGAKGLKNRTAF
jgi:hypothetical protein